jgi:predicted RNA-binding protein YlxR (DUF448 family)
VETAIKKRLLNKSFKTKVPDEIYVLLENTSTSEYTGK